MEISGQSQDFAEEAKLKMERKFKVMRGGNSGNQEQRTGKRDDCKGKWRREKYVTQISSCLDKLACTPSINIFQDLIYKTISLLHDFIYLFILKSLNTFKLLESMCHLIKYVYNYIL